MLSARQTMNTHNANVTGLILPTGPLASGPLLPMGKGSVLSCVVDSLVSAGIHPVEVVVGRRAPTLANLNAHIIRADGDLPSLQAGIARVCDTSTDAVLVVPADVPLVRPHTMRRLLDEFRAHPERVLYPTFTGTRGRMALVPHTMFYTIIDCENMAELHEHLGAEAHYVPVPDSGILFTMERMEDYGTATRRYERIGIPTQEECSAVLEICHTPRRVINHCHTVCRVATCLAAKMKEYYHIDTELLLAGAVLHDVAKGHEEHEIKGGEILRGMGFRDVVPLVASHKDLPHICTPEAELLYLSDKIVDGTNISTLDARLEKMRAKYPADSDSYKAALVRITRAMDIMRKVESATNMPLEDILRDCR